MLVESLHASLEPQFSQPLVLRAKPRDLVLSVLRAAHAPERVTWWGRDAAAAVVVVIVVVAEVNALLKKVVAVNTVALVAAALVTGVAVVAVSIAAVVTWCNLFTHALLHGALQRLLAALQGATPPLEGASAAAQLGVVPGVAHVVPARDLERDDGGEQRLQLQQQSRALLLWAWGVAWLGGDT